MKHIVILTLFNILTISVFSQEKQFQIETQNNNLEEVLNKIEQISNKEFYYAPQWLQNSDKVYNNTYTGSLDEIINEILKETELNYFIHGNSVILTKNNIIYNELPKNYFAGNNPSTANQYNPIFYETHYNPKQEKDSLEQEVLSFIGKETKKQAQESYVITGKITDIKTGNPVPFINVSTINNSINTTSNSNGSFSIVLPRGLNTLKANSLEYESSIKKIMVYSDGTIDFYMTENINQLDEVVITSDSKRNIRTATTGVSTIDMEETKTIPLVLGERDVIKIATIMPGVKTAGEGAQGFNVRGGMSDQNLVLLDDAVIYNPFHFFGFFSAINPYVIKSAKIYKGSIPAEFGGRLSSVFDIQSKTIDKQKFSGEGAIGPVTSNLTASIPIIKDKAGLTVGGRATYAGYILNNLKSDQLNNSEASFYDAFFKYEHEINKNNSFSATGYYSKDRFSVTSDSIYAYHNALASIRYRHEINDDHFVNIQLNHSDYKYDIDYQANSTQDFNFGYNVNETHLKAHFNYSMNKRHTFTYGVSSKLYNINPGELNPIGENSSITPLQIQKEKGLESALFLSDSYELNDKLLINLGIRYSNFVALGSSRQTIYEIGLPKSEATAVETLEYKNNEIIDTYGGMEYRFSARYFLNDNLSIKGSFDTNRQYVHLLSTNTTQSPTDTWKLSDLNVEPQTSKQYSLGFFQNLKNDMYEVSLEGYYKNLDNILDYKTGAQLLLNEDLETELLQGKGKAYGTEFLIKKNQGSFTGWLGYTYSRTFIKLDSEFSEERVNNGKYFPTNFDKPHDFSLVLNYKLTSRYSFSANFIYQTGRPITYPTGTFTYGNAEYTLYSDRNKFRIPDYYRLDLGVNIEANHKKDKLVHGFWNISVYNVLGRNNPYSIYFVTENGDVKGYKTSIFSIPVPTVSYNFKF